jgi:hypothetical protein
VPEVVTAEIDAMVASIGRSAAAGPE